MCVIFIYVVNADFTVYLYIWHHDISDSNITLE